MKLVELRIPMPYSADDYIRGQQYAIARSLKEDIESKQRPALIKELGNGKSVKMYDISKMVSALKLIKPLMKSESMILNESANFIRNASRCIYSTELTPKSTIEIQSRILDCDVGLSEQVFSGDIGLDGAGHLGTYKYDTLEVDFACHKLCQKYYTEEEDPLKTANSFTGQLLDQNWLTDLKTQHSTAAAAADGAVKTPPPSSCVYKACKINMSFALIFSLLQSKVENLVLNTGMIDTAVQFHRRVYAWEKEWRGMSDEELQEFIKKCNKYILENSQL